MSGVPIVDVKDLIKRFGKTTVLQGINLSASRGMVLGVLGPNGAGKTTAINCLTTLLVPDGGQATIAGYDVVKQPEAVRSLISLTGQFAAVDEALTARENLVLFGRLLRLSSGAAKRRAQELLIQFDLVEAADRQVKTFSGGMRRRLDLAASIVVLPLVLFLDEPTTGLDPRSRQQLWAVVKDLKAQGITIILTTQYLEEADALADQIVVIDHGRVIAEGTVDELKDRVGGKFCELRLANLADVKKVRELLSDMGDVVTGEMGENGPLAIAAPKGANTLTEIVMRLEAAGIAITDISMRRPSLDDVFFKLTGHTTKD
ncbi:ATP-binding cassette domain-containing protein [cf. Phormidesmis sp. LEGE 11477]|uniref:ATP-binding cassette domain-containing protein n=1 Tax=cf. Phormidesmis sp. LEGE 11477 TaxID=1828680 RepID=UPI00187F058C|nr:ATP-binding cassette domain-containing protein [cf. Phormidesmis sp. LEGE 11477]MBE9059761.1 ATP-binding cassette domain-containing protein [cf. Phormidesmis sp. LEGE 11477]